MAGDTRIPTAVPVVRGERDAEQLVLDVLSRHADSLLKTARNHSLCADDAHDAYQRMVEIFLRRASSLDAELAFKWAHTVVKHEAMRVREGRLRLVGGEAPELDDRESDVLRTDDEHVASFDLMARSAEALQQLKPAELRALWLRAQGLVRPPLRA